MAESEPAHQNDEKCQQLRYFQVRREWLLKLKLIVLTVLCVLLGVFLMIYKVQAHLKETQKHDEALKLSDKETHIKQIEDEKKNLTRQLTDKDEHIEQIQDQNNYLTSQFEENEDRIKQLEAGKRPGDPKSYCARGWKYFRAKCYYFSTDEKTWTASRGACEAAGGHLVIVSSPEEQDFLKKSKPADAEQKYWIGLTDAVTEGDWRWLDGTRLSKTPKLWAGNEPDNWKGEKEVRPDGEDCAHITISTASYGLMDAFCDSQKKRICEAKAPIKLMKN